MNIRARGRVIKRVCKRVRRAPKRPWLYSPCAATHGAHFEDGAKRSLHCSGRSRPLRQVYAGVQLVEFSVLGR